MIKHLLPAVMLTILMTALTGLAYPLAMTTIAQHIFPHQANGSLVERDGKVIGSELIGQNFTSDGYFHGRPSATTDTDPNDPTKTVPAPYNADNSGGSNLGPTSKALVDRVREEAKALAAQNPAAPVPVDLVTTSASGLDPDITPAAALFQIPRVAKARDLAEDRLRRLVDDNTTARLFGLLGEPHVNVLKLNLALDKEFPTRGGPETAAAPSVAEATPAPAAAPATTLPEAPPEEAATSAPQLEATPEEAATPAPVETPAAQGANAPVAAASEPPAAQLATSPPAVEAPALESASVFPSHISPAHAAEKPLVARRKTCLDQFHANATANANANGGLKWKEYWKQCEKHLKG